MARGATTPDRRLIVNADDFGRSGGINRGIMAAYTGGIVTSASLMVRWPHAARAAAYSTEHPRLSLGLHVDMGEWVYRGSEWTPAYEVVPLDNPSAVAEEAARQLDRFCSLVGRTPTHLDSHQHVHRFEPVRSILTGMAVALGVPLRQCTSPVRYCGAFYGQTATGEVLPDAISSAALVRIFEHLPSGVTELACHPGRGHDIPSPYRPERSAELRVLCDPLVRRAMNAANIQLCSFHDVTDVLQEPTP